MTCDRLKLISPGLLASRPCCAFRRGTVARQAGGSSKATVMTNSQIDEATKAKFWAGVNKRGENECWEWMRCKNSTGYGIFYVGVKSTLAHRFSYLINRGEIGNDALGRPLCALHRCDNPPCVNPNHLFLGTRGDNLRDMISKGRQVKNPRFGENHPGRKLTESLVLEIAACRGGNVRIISERFNLPHGTVAGVIYGQSWSWLTGFRKYKQQNKRNVICV